MLVVDKARCKLYELYAARPHAGGARWSAGSGAIWNLRSNKLRPAGHSYGSLLATPLTVVSRRRADRRWDNDDLHTLDRLKGSDFEVVNTRSLTRPK